MRRRPTFRVIAAFAMIVIIAGLGLFIVTLGDTAKLSETASLGPSPTLPEPTKSLVLTVNIAYAEGWPEGGKPLNEGGRIGRPVTIGAGDSLISEHRAGRAAVSRASRHGRFSSKPKSACVRRPSSRRPSTGSRR